MFIERREAAAVSRGAAPAITFSGEVNQDAGWLGHLGDSRQCARLGCLFGLLLLLLNSCMLHEGESFNFYFWNSAHSSIILR